MFRNGNGSATGRPGPGAGESLLRDSPIELNIYPTGQIFNWVNMVHASQAEIFGDV